MKIENVDNNHHITINAEELLKFEYIMYSKYAYEFTAFWHAERREGDEFHLSKVFFPRQDNTGTTTECDSDDIMDLLEEGLDVSLLSGHSHSHVNMAVFSSGTDKADIHERAKDGLFNAAFIMNKKGEMFGHIVDMTTGHYYTDVDIYVDYPFEDEEFEEGLLDIIRSAKTVAEAATYSKMNKWAYFEQVFGLTEEEKAELDLIVKERFKYKHTSYSTNYSKKKEEVNQATKNTVIPLQVSVENEQKGISSIGEYEASLHIQQHNHFDWGAANDYEDAIINSYGNGYQTSADLLADDELAELSKFTDEELELWQEIKNKSTMELTDAEWILWDKMYNLGGRYPN